MPLTGDRCLSSPVRFKFLFGRYKPVADFPIWGVAGGMSDINIPADASRLVDFLNSRGAGFGASDSLPKPKTAVGIARRFQIDKGRVPLDQSTILRMRRLRSALFAILEADVDQKAAWNALNETSSSISLRYEFSPPGTVAVRQHSGDRVIGGILQSIARLISDGQWARLNVCANERCAMAFYDTTRSKTQRWHSYAICGNKKNVAAYRARSGSS